MERLGAGTVTEVRKEAAGWLIQMDAEPETWNRLSFVEWLKSSPRHMEEFIECSQLWALLHDVTSQGIDDDVREVLNNNSSNIVDWPQNAQKQEQGADAHKHRWWWFSGLAAVMLIFASAVAWSLLQHNVKVLTTAIGEQRAVRLSDHSIVHLNTDSRVEVRFTDAAREVNLVRGEALFSVERDVNRPFRVHTGSIQVEALGTQFNVKRRISDTIVSVVEGRVAVVRPIDVDRPLSKIAPLDSPTPNVSVFSVESTRAGGTTRDNEPTEQSKKTEGIPDAASSLPYEAGRSASPGALALVTAGEQVRISADGIVEQEATKNVGDATAWRQRQLVFTNTPLADVATEIARYNITPRLQIEGEALRSRQLNGIFAADDPESLIQFLERDSDLAITRIGDSVIISAR
jgi:transmembrane sensor